MSWFDLILSSYQFLSSYHLIWIYLLENLWFSKIFEVTTSCCSSCLSLIQTFENLCPVAHPQLIFPSACSFAEFRAWQCWISTSQCFLVSLTLKKKVKCCLSPFTGGARLLNASQVGFQQFLMTKPTKPWNKRWKLWKHDDFKNQGTDLWCSLLEPFGQVFLWNSTDSWNEKNDRK